MQFIQTARELKQHTLTVVKKCPKRLQFFLLGPRAVPELYASVPRYCKEVNSYEIRIG